MGLKDNAIPMTMLANKISYKIFYDRYNLNEIKVAYLFASGLYNEINPSIEMISKKYQLLPLSKDIWMHKGIDLMHTPSYVYLKLSSAFII